VSHKGRFGNIVSAWKKEGETVNYTVVVPPNSAAELHFDASVKQVTRTGQNEALDLSMPVKLEAGKYEFIIK
jgi:alpha-L-rhamnosidase